MTTDIDLFCRDLRVGNRCTNTIAQYRDRLRRWVGWLADRGVHPYESSRDDVLDFLARYDEPETIRYYRGALNLWHQWLVDVERRPDNPFHRIPSVRQPDPNPNPIPDALLMEALAGACEWDRNIIVLGRFAGLRAAEISRAHPRYLRRQREGSVVRLRGKGSRWRELPAHPEVERVLSAPGFVFPSHVYPGQPVLPASISQRMARFLPGGYTCHDLRAAFAQDVYNRSGSLETAQAYLGHRSVSTTLRYVTPRHDWSVIGQLSLS